MDRIVDDRGLFETLIRHLQPVQQSTWMLRVLIVLHLCSTSKFSVSLHLQRCVGDVDVLSSRAMYCGQYAWL